MKTVLTIAGSDCSGGAGIQADLKTMTAHKVYGMSVITALTAQNTTGVYGILDAGADFVGRQMDCVFKDIFPDAVKIGMVSNIETIQMIASKLQQYGAKNIVIDPVMVSTSGCALMSPDAMDTLIETLLPLGDVITPNIPEAEKLCGFEITTIEDMVRAAEVIGIPDQSIGEQLYNAKVYLDTPELFAWTIVIIMLSFLFERFFLWLIDRVATILERMR